jgi:uncharacterized protein YcsI (UPF0317 family)
MLTSGSSRRTIVSLARRGAGVDRSAAQDVWRSCRSGELSLPTPGLAPGFVQANLVMLPKEDAVSDARVLQALSFPSLAQHCCAARDRFF